MLADQDRNRATGFDALMEGARAVLGPSLALSWRLGASGAAVEAGGDRGAWVELTDGRRLLDVGSYGTTFLGRTPERVIRAVTEALLHHPTTTRSVANPLVVECARQLLEAIGSDRLARVWFGSNGSDAVECALKLARVGTGRPRVVALEGAYHGKSLGALMATASPRFRVVPEAVADATTFVPIGDLDAMERALGPGDAAIFIFEPVQGEGGAEVVPEPFLVAATNMARRAGARVVADEVQCGLGRCGEMSVAMASAYADDVDAVVLGKSLGGGVIAVSALLSTDDLAGPLDRDHLLHTHTHAGHPVACAAAMGALETLRSLTPKIRVDAERLDRILTTLRRAHADVVASTPGLGLLRGIRLHDATLAGDFTLALRDQGLVVSPCLTRPQTVRLLVPAVLESDDYDLFVTALDTALGVVVAQAGAGS